jgi:hypothetical protein
MIRKTWPTNVQGKWWTWTPLPGLDPGLEESVYRLGAAKWATARSEGKPEKVAQQEAERLMFETTYGVSYSWPGMKSK